MPKELAWIVVAAVAIVLLAAVLIARGFHLF
jgi:hypothetical protein